MGNWEMEDMGNIDEEEEKEEEKEERVRRWEKNYFLSTMML